MDVELGIIEGFYGRPWTWAERAETIAFLAPHGYRFYLYAPKADLYLRRRWKEPHPEADAQNLAALAARCRELGVRFGVGISPFELYTGFDDAAREALGRKLAFADELGVQDLAILFDDMKGDQPDLADRQADIVDWAAGRTGADRVIVCPSYYTDDPVLDRDLWPAAGRLPGASGRTAGPRHPGVLDGRGGGGARVLAPAPGARGRADPPQAVPVGQLPGKRRAADVAVPAPARRYGPAGGHG